MFYLEASSQHVLSERFCRESAKPVKTTCSKLLGTESGNIYSHIYIPPPALHARMPCLLISTVSGFEFPYNHGCKNYFLFSQKKKSKAINKRCEAKHTEITAQDSAPAWLSPCPHRQTADERQVVFLMPSHVWSGQCSAVLVYSVLPKCIIRKQRQELAGRAFQELSQRYSLLSPRAAEIRALSFPKESWSLASLTSSIGGSSHDGCYPGNLAVGDAVHALELFKVDRESLRKCICKPN